MDNKNFNRRLDRLVNSELKETDKQSALKYRIKLKFVVLAYYSSTDYPSCARCGNSDLDVLAIDHIGGGGKEHRKQANVGAGWKFYRWLKQNGFPTGYQVLCFNCNIKKYIREGI